MLGGVAERAFWDYPDPDLARESYTLSKITVPFLGGAQACSANLIGPNLLLTAAHCGVNDGPTTAIPGASTAMLFYDDSNFPRSEVFSCRTLLASHNDTDLALWYCTSVVAGGIPPGLKYGYGDFDIQMADSRPFGFNYYQSRAMESVGRSVDRFWWNGLGTPPNGNPGDPGYQPASASYIPGNHNLYGAGTITQTGGVNWENPGNVPLAATCDGVNVQTIGILSNVMSTSGSSGSSHWSSDNRRILLGPLTVAAQAPVETFSSEQLGIADYVFWGSVRQTTNGNCTVGHMNTSLIDGTLGLNSTNYYKWVDKDLDGVFDIQKDLEAVLGEYSRSFYWLGFESNRRNVQWNRYLDNNHMIMTPSVGTGTLRMLPSNGSQNWVKAASRTDLNLSSGTYVATYDVYTATGVSGPDIKICIGASCFNSYGMTGAWIRQVAQLTTTAGAEVSIWVKDSAEITIRNFSLQKYLTPFNFDTAEQRRAWNGRTDIDTGLFWPDGVGTTSTSAGFAGVVTRDPNYSLGNDWSLRTRYTGMLPWHAYRVCYSSRDSVRDPQSLVNGWVIARVLDNTSGSELTRSWGQVPRGSGWTIHCFGDFLPTSLDVEIEFGIWQAGSGSILVDDVYVEER